jgi:hypothetical protein
MLQLVTIDDARQQLRLDEIDSNGGADDAWLDLAIPGVSEAVRTWLKDEWRLYLPERDTAGVIITDTNGDPIPAEDTSGNPITHPTVRLAVLLELASQFRYREGEGENVVTADAGHGYTLSKGATAILAGLRKPTLA